MKPTRVTIPAAAPPLPATVSTSLNGKGAITEERSAELAKILELRRFDITKPPLEAAPVYCLGDAPIGTGGNLVAVAAKPKAGKTAFVGAMLASTIAPDGDFLGVSSSNPLGLAVLHFDTEQSPADHHAVITKALQRAGCTTPPDWLRSYRLADVPLLVRNEALRFELARAEQECGGIHSVQIDGVGDLCSDPNDTKESFALVDELHQLAIRYNTPIFCILHENPGTDIGKTRGHLGSQLERKAETNLRLDKDADGVIVVFAERARHAHIPRNRGPRFTWDDEQKMHVSTVTVAENKGSAKREKLTILAGEVFRDVPEGVGLSWAQTHERIEEIEGLKRAGASRRFDDLLTAKTIHKSRERYHLSTA